MRACILVLERNTLCLPVCMCMIMTFVPRFVWFGVLLFGEEAFSTVWGFFVWVFFVCFICFGLVLF